MSTDGQPSRGDRDPHGALEIVAAQLDLGGIWRVASAHHDDLARLVRGDQKRRA
jgi:hypothetical protein